MGARRRLRAPDAAARAGARARAPGPRAGLRAARADARRGDAARRTLRSVPGAGVARDGDRAAAADLARRDADAPRLPAPRCAAGPVPGVARADSRYRPAARRLRLRTYGVA